MIAIDHPEPPPLIWTTAQQPPALGATDLHLWRIPTQVALSGTIKQALLALLSDAEHERHARLLNPVARDRYLLTHGAMRRILAGYLDQAPAALQFAHGSAGKPSLPGMPPPLHFNLSTSVDLSLLALSRREAVGIDCEPIERPVDILNIAQRMFSATAAWQLARTAPEHRPLAFCRAWTALEARVKCDGRGLARHRDPDPPGVEVRHARVAPGTLCAIARRALPPPHAWVARQWHWDGH